MRAWSICSSGLGYFSHYNFPSSIHLLANFVISFFFTNIAFYIRTNFPYSFIH